MVGKLVPRPNSRAYDTVWDICGDKHIGGSVPDGGRHAAVMTRWWSTFATAGTGGFSVKNASIAGYNSSYAEYVISVFLLLFSINFNLYFFILLKYKAHIQKRGAALVLGIVAVSVIAVAVNIHNMYPTVEEIIRKRCSRPGNLHGGLLHRF